MRRLPDDLVDQIAAGEVVERPASVVKELVENAVDAGARRIRVEVRAGGAALVAVGDDGFGMVPEDAVLALERHATSKLASAEDLTRLRSFGFRGEALPAIASVSRLRLRTRARGAAEGVEIRVDHGRAEPPRAAGGPEGTRIEVADLFAGVPARRKFLKSAATEWGHICDWLSRGALALPGVHFEVHRDGKEAFAWPAVADPLDRIAAVLSEDEAAILVPARGQEGSLALRAFVSRPDAHRPSATGLYLFVNGRPVRDRLLRHALLEVYRDWLPRGRFPVAVLDLTLPPEAVDVNVHPAKWEVRFADPRAVHALVRHAVRDAVAERRWIAPGSGEGPQAAPHDSERSATPGGFGSPAAYAGFPPPPPSPGGLAPPAQDWVFARSGAPADRVGEGPLALWPEPARATTPVRERVRFADLRLLGQLLGTYLLLEAKDGLVLVDQHAAHERVLYERLRAAWLAGGAERQALLLPVTVEIDPARLAALVAGEGALALLGFEVEEFGAGTAVIRAVPAVLADREPAALLRSLADQLLGAPDPELAGAGGEGPAAVRALESADRLFASLACHAARRAGDVLEAREQRALLDALDGVPWAPCCPHGRPVAVPLAVAEIERRFGRR